MPQNHPTYIFSRGWMLGLNLTSRNQNRLVEASCSRSISVLSQTQTLLAMDHSLLIAVPEMLPLFYHDFSISFIVSICFHNDLPEFPLILLPFSLVPLPFLRAWGYGESMGIHNSNSVRCETMGSRAGWTSAIQMTRNPHITDTGYSMDIPTKLI